MDATCVAWQMAAARQRLPHPTPATGAAMGQLNL
jgi:hypothetical protein